MTAVLTTPRHIIDFSKLALYGQDSRPTHHGAEKKTTTGFEQASFSSRSKSSSIAATFICSHNPRYGVCAGRGGASRIKHKTATGFDVPISMKNVAA